MIKLGMIQTLQIIKKVEFGVYLGDGADRTEKVLLPKKQVPEQAQIGDEVEVFVYRDSKDRLIATVHTPRADTAQCGESAGRAGGQSRRFFGLGIGKRSVIAVQGADEKSVGRRRVSCGALY